jgi:uncharacterized membrane protein YeaQ/YmgE (transglycosylase-associated protein family)
MDFLQNHHICPEIQEKGGKNMGIIWTIVLGLVIGLIAKLIHPGKENMGIIMTILLGIAGSFLAGSLTTGWYRAASPPSSSRFFYL